MSKKNSLFSRLFGKKSVFGNAKPNESVSRPTIEKDNSGIQATQLAKSDPAVTQPSPVTLNDGRITDGAQTLAAPAYKDEAQIQVAEKDVPVEWNVGDTILDLYEVKQIYGGGGMGLVYRVHHKGWNMDLAVKSPRAELLMKPGAAENFTRECETWIDLGLHPNIVSCYYVRNLGGVPRVFAEYVEGGSLKDWIETKKLYEGGKDKALERILDIAIQFAWGLQYAHEKGLVHQDVKPANVMMTDDGTAKVTDFGLAKARAIIGDAQGVGEQQGILVSTGGMTPAYCSPEHANHQPVSHKTDIWSWAVSILEMFTGEVTWMGGQVAAEALDGYLETGPEDKEIPKIPELLAELLRHCFQNNPDDRPTDIAAIADRLKTIYRGSTKVKEDYYRPEPKAAELLADGLNNKALSMLDLGKKGEAEKIYDEALKIDPHHMETTYNRSLLLWRSGRMTDIDVVNQMEEVRTTHPDEWRDEYFLGLIHLERNDYKSATVVLEDAAKRESEDPYLYEAIEKTIIGLKKGLSFSSIQDNISYKVLFSPDGCWALSINKSMIKLWDIQTTSCVRTFEGHTDEIRCIQLSSDCRWALSGGADNTVRLWEINTGQLIKIFKGHSSWIMSVVFDPENRWILSTSQDKTMRLWDINTGQCIRVFQEFFHHTPDEANFISNGSSILCLVRPNNIKYFNPIDGKCEKTVTGNLKRIVYNPNGRMIVYGERDITLAEIPTHQILQNIKCDYYQISSLAFSPDGQWLLSAGGQKANLWDITTGRCLNTFNGNKRIDSVSFSHDGNWVVTGGDYSIQIWNIRTSQCVSTITIPLFFVDSVTFSLDDHWILLVGKNTIMRWGPFDKFEPYSAPSSFCRPPSLIETIQREKQFMHLLSEALDSIRESNYQSAFNQLKIARNVSGFERSPKAMNLISELYHYGRRKILTNSWKQNSFSSNIMAFSPDSQSLLFSTESNELTLWQINISCCLQNFEGHTDRITSAGFSPNGRLVVSGSRDGTVRIWDIGTGKCIQKLPFVGDNERVEVSLEFSGRFVAFSPDGNKVRFDYHQMRSTNEIVKLYHLNTGNYVRRVFDAPDRIAFSPDFRMLLVGDYDGVKLIDIFTDNCIRTFDKRIVSAVFSHNGHWVLLGCQDNTIMLWNIVSNQIDQVFKGHEESLKFMVFSFDDRYILSQSFNGTAKLWEVNTGLCLRTFVSEMCYSIVLSPDSRWLALGKDLFQFDWDLEFFDLADWNENARPNLEKFLALYSYSEDGIKHIAKPSWNEDDYKYLLQELKNCGYGWLRPEGVRKKLQEMAANWQGPPPLPKQ